MVNGEEGFLVVDVRSPEEYSAFHISGAVNVQLPELIDYLAPLKNQGRIVLYSNGMTHPAQARSADASPETVGHHATTVMISSARAYAIFGNEI